MSPSHISSSLSLLPSLHFPLSLFPLFLPSFFPSSFLPSLSSFFFFFFCFFFLFLMWQDLKQAVLAKTNTLNI